MEKPALSWPHHCAIYADIMGLMMSAVSHFLQTKSQHVQVPGAVPLSVRTILYIVCSWCKGKSPPLIQHVGDLSETCTFSLLTFREACGRSTQTPSPRIWHKATTAVTGQAGSHDSFPSSGSKLIPDHSSSIPAATWSHSHFHWSWYQPHDQNGIWVKSNQVTHGLWKGRPGFWGHLWQQTIPVGNSLMSVNHLFPFMDVDSTWDTQGFTSMQRQGKSRSYWKVALFTGSSFLIWKVVKTFFSLSHTVQTVSVPIQSLLSEECCFMSLFLQLNVQLF